MSEREPWPTELRVSEGGARLTIAFDDGASYAMSAEYLRVSSPSAEARGHSPAERVLQTGKRLVKIVAVTPVGNYAARLTFDDGHASGLYTFAFLHELGREADARWRVYLDELAAAGAGRD